MSIRQRSDAPCVGGLNIARDRCRDNTKLSAHNSPRRLVASFKDSRDWIPRVINTDKNPAYGEAIAELKKAGAIAKELEHRQVKYLNNRLKCTTASSNA